MIKKIIKWKNNGFKVGIANGCFDLLHKGHLYLLKKSKSKCDKLIVLLNSDSSVKKIKGKNRPIENQTIRRKKLMYNKYIDGVIIFNEVTPLKKIKEIKPDFIFKGSDYKKKEVIGYNFIKKYDGKVILISLLKKYSTSSILKKNVKKNNR